MIDPSRIFFLLLCRRLFVLQAIVFECKSSNSCGCSRNNVDLDLRILGGEMVVPHSWAWAVSMRNSYGEHICGGTILSKTFILTAAHCFHRISKEYRPYSIIVGVDSLLSTTGQIRMVSDVIIHPKWNSSTKENDIALLRLDTPMSLDDPNLSKICLPDVTTFHQQIRYPMLHSSLIAIGWGITTWEDLISPMYLRQVALQVIDPTESKCKKIIKNVHVQFCAAVKGGEKDTCQGDSGSPIMHFSIREQRWILTGIISYGYHCALRDYAAVYTRISVYLNWIKSIVGNDGIVIIQESHSSIHLPWHLFINLTLTFFLCTYLK